MLSVPLTSGQCLRLAGRCAAPVFWVIAFGAAWHFVRGRMEAQRTVVLGLIALFLFLFAHAALRAWQDLSLGSALVDEDVLETTFGSTRKYARFRRLGRMTLTGNSYTDSMPRERHRVTYSPHSKLVWKLERLQ